MKKPEAFERKRLIRDKANHRWVKSRHYVWPAFFGLQFTGAILGGTIGLAVDPNGAAAGALGGSFLALMAGGNYIVRRLCD